MKSFEPPSTPLSSTISMVEGKDIRSGWFSWWYRVAAPHEPDAAASFKLREAYRRGRLISIALLVQMLIMLVVMFTVGLFVNRALIPNIGFTLALLAIATFFNRRGQVIISGSLAVAGLDLSLMGNLFSYPTFDVFLLPMLDLLVLPELFAVSLLPPRSVFISAGVHICFIIAALTGLFRLSPQLHALLQTTALQDALARPIVIQILVASITYLWVRSATQAIERANRATSIAALERETAEEYQQAAEKNLQLEESIDQIVHVHTQVANGDFSARVPQGNTLWQIAGSLNNLLNRVQRLRKEAYQFQATHEALMRFLQERQRSQIGPIHWQPTETMVDLLVLEHNRRAQSSGEPTPQV